MHKYSLLYAEDDRETLENYAYVLKKYFKEVYTAEDGEKALKLYHDKRPDILLLDISMPKIDGLKLVQVLRETDQETAILMLTAHSEQKNLLKAIPLGLSDYLLKPVDDVLLINTLKSMIVQLDKKNIVTLKQTCLWNKNSALLSCDAIEIALTKKERILMQMLIVSYGYYVSKETLIEEIWSGETSNTSQENKLIQLVYRFNKKVALIIQCKEPFIENSYDLGYKLSSN